jgi:hypothetical protein
VGTLGRDCGSMHFLSTMSSDEFSWRLFSLTPNSTPLMNFSSALNYCIEQGGSLAIIRDNDTFRLLSDLFQEAYNSLTRHAFVGLTQTNTSLEPDGNWYWFDGTPLSSTSYLWASGQPDNLGVENCGSLFNPLTNKSGLNDLDCDLMKPAFCEFSSHCIFALSHPAL